MYKFSSKLRSFAFVMMALGFVGMAYGYFTTPHSDAEIEEYIKQQHDEHHGSHGNEHHEAEAHKDASHAEKHAFKVEDSLKKEVAAHDSTAHLHDSTHVAIDTSSASAVAHVDENHHDDSKNTAHVDHDAEHKKHFEHVKHALHNKPLSAIYVACIFFLFISLGALAYYAIQWAAQAGWSPVVFRVMEGVTAYLPVGSVIFFLLVTAILMHVGDNHIFLWSVKEVVEEDHLIKAKSGYLNVPFFLIRALIFLGGWNLYRYISRKNSINLDKTKDLTLFKKNYKAAAAFLAFFIVSESMMSWDWVMSVDPHWYSTLFGWYVFASFFVSGITTITMIVIYLQSRGYLKEINKSHLHDLAKFMFAISIFWTYLWFSQFMLIWYSNIPEEVTYFVTRIEDYNLPFFMMIPMNFLFPLLILMNADYKRLTWIVVMAGIVILAGHYLDFYNMIMPATVGKEWFIGATELGALAFFGGLFIYVVFNALTKANLISEGNPFIEESKHFHY